MRAINAVRELNEENDEQIRVIALYTEQERHALFVRQADEHHCLGPAMVEVEGEDDKTISAYLDYERLERALRETEADSAWVGWGFVAEHPAFPELCEKLGITFIGPSADVMRLLGDKIEGKKLAEKAGVPVAPWSGGPVETAEEAKRVGEELGFPLMIKAAAGGGGRGMRKVESEDELEQAIERARSEAEQAFGDPSVLMERLVGEARHVEVQLMADGDGGVWALGVRDCSYQRRHQKVVEESASPVLSAEQEQELAESASRLALEAGYQGAATVEFLYEPESGNFSFMEVNTRLQVEHPVTEEVTGADLVRLQLHVAGGGKLEGDPPPPRGHAIEVRLNAEDPGRGFSPAPGRITLLRLPAGPGIRVDSGVAEGDHVPPEFDSMIAKIIAHGDTREQAIARLRRAVADTMVALDEGTTNQGFLLELLGRDELRKGEVDTGWLDRLQAAGDVQPDAPRRRRARAGRDRARRRRQRRRARALLRARAPRPPGRRRRRLPHRRPPAPRRQLPLHRLPDRAAALPRRDRRRAQHRGDRRAADRAREPARVRRARLPHGDRAAGRRPARRGRRRAAPDLARRGRPDPQPRPRRRGGDPGLRGRRGAGRRRRGRDRVDEDGELADRDRERQGPRGARLAQLARPGRQAAAADRPAGGGVRRRRGRAHQLRRARRRRGADRARRARVADPRLRLHARDGQAGARQRLRRPRRRAAPARALRRRPHAQPPARRRPRRRGRARQPAGAPARVPALARRRGRGPARALRRAPDARARALRGRGPRAHRRARGRRLPPVPLAAARADRARGAARRARPPPGARRPARGRGRRRAARRARPAGGLARAARARARRAHARGALALHRRARRWPAGARPSSRR